MKKRLIEHVNDKYEGNYRDVNDLLKDLQYRSAEQNYDILIDILTHIEKEEETK